MDPLGRCIIVNLIFIILAAFYSSAAALLSALRAPDEDEDNGLINRLYRKKNVLRYRLMSAAAVCVMICGSASAYFMYDSFAPIFKEYAGLGAVLFALISTTPAAVLGIYLPTAFPERVTVPQALYSAVTVALHTSYIFAALPVLISRLVLKIAGVEPDTARSDVTEQEILQLVDEGESSGAINSEEREMIENIIDFSERTVREVMTHYMDMAAIKSDAEDGDILRVIRETGYSRYPVCRDDITEIEGILIAKEYLTDRLSDEPHSLGELIREPLFVPDSMQTSAALRAMNTQSQHMAIVVNEYGEACGIVTMEDLLEEIVGKIYDETDTADDRDPEMQKTEDGAYLIHATCSIEDFEEFAEIELEEKDGIDTMGALVFSKMNAIPDDGISIDVETEDLLLHSDGLSDRRLEWIVVRIKEDEE